MCHRCKNLQTIRILRAATGDYHSQGDSGGGGVALFWAGAKTGLDPQVLRTVALMFQYLTQSRSQDPVLARWTLSQFRDVRLCCVQVVRVDGTHGAGHC